jgi:hypothetical protein
MEVLFQVSRAASRHWRNGAAWLVLSIVFLGGFTQTAAKDEALAEPSPAKLDVNGYGFFGNLELKRLLRVLDPERAKREFYDAIFIEDALLLLMSRVNRDGYLKPRITAHLTLLDGEIVSYEWDRPLEEPLPRELKAKVVRFEIQKGILYHYRHIRFDGAAALSRKTALSYFIETGALIALKQNKVYTPGRLRRGLSSLTEVLMRQGYENAQVTAEDLRINTKRERWT